MEAPIAVRNKSANHESFARKGLEDIAIGTRISELLLELMNLSSRLKSIRCLLSAALIKEWIADDPNGHFESGPF